MNDENGNTVDTSPIVSDLENARVKLLDIYGKVTGESSDRFLQVIALVNGAINKLV